MEFEEPEDIDEIREFMDDADEDIQIEELERSFAECVAVNNLPIVDDSKKSKLEGMLHKIFGQVGQVVRLDMPMEEGKSLGFAYVEFARPEEAIDAVSRVDGYKLAKTNQFKVVRMDELCRLDALPPAFEEPAPPPFRPPVNSCSWLCDPGHRDQFVTRYSHTNGTVEETQIDWVENGQSPIMEYDGAREKSGGKSWCQLEVRWSPKGTYMSTFHRQGIALWGGDGFEKQARFQHENVNRVSFSPCERYMLTCNFRPPREGPSVVLFWHIREARVLRKIDLAFTTIGEGEDMREVPNLFKWSPDGNYVARMHQDRSAAAANSSKNGLIQVLELPSVTLLDRKSLRANSVMDFDWSPKDNTIAFWAAEEGNTPARVSLVAIPSRKELRQKNLFNVVDCRLNWQRNGNFLSAIVTRTTKSGKTQFNNLEIFRIREDAVPVEMIEVPKLVQSVSWEPEGTRFTMVCHDNPKPSVMIYDTVDAKSGRQELTLLKELVQRPVTDVFWSPTGTHFVMAALSDGGDSSGALEFYDADALPEKGTLSDHYRSNFLQWDPSGRMIATAVLQPLTGMVYKFQMDNGFKLWTFQGEMFYEKSREKFYQFMWRPRPESLLTPQQKKTVSKNLRKYERKFERADKEKRRARELLEMKGWQDSRNQLRARLADLKARYYDAVREQRVAERGGVDVDDPTGYELIETVKEEVIQVKEDLIVM
eukprot:CAMPEP_0118962468 /NCGR_PEP_ID=MMETSP1173-20130426/799_1 /TAXON_ID=1034831 /ORGANISM="Rhizochromulina marina cf, Strain CCMP1243" /LENGTH=706 /DNA_ID=CAMNT_0006910737 /DNA_START=45 /DNA_END=2165 /DNA_ORIENTATION=-